jgi:hypothetical protein
MEREGDWSECSWLVFGTNEMQDQMKRGTIEVVNPNRERCSNLRADSILEQVIGFKKFSVRTKSG